MIAILSQPEPKAQAKLVSLTHPSQMQSDTRDLANHPVAVTKTQVPSSSQVLTPKKEQREPLPVKPLDPAPLVAAPAPAPTPAPLNPWKWTPLVDDVRLLFRTEIPDLGGLPLLYYAVLHDDGEWISELISKGANANERTPAGDTPLCAGIRYLGSESVRALLYGGAEPIQTGYEKQPPIALASLRRGADNLRALAAAGADPNTRFNSPISRDLLERVLIKDLKHSMENDRGVTPLIACSARGDVEGATELLRAGAKAGYCTTRYKRYPINFAATQGYLFLMRILLGRQPDSEPQTLVTVNLTSQRAWVVKEGQVVDTCLVSTGREGFATPAGRYVVTDKHRDWTSTLYHVSMPFFMRLNCSAIGLHSGYVTGRPASHGCIRLPYEKAKKFFGLVSVGDEVQIVY